MQKPKKLPSGSWRTQVNVMDSEGKKKRVSITALTKAECEYKAAEAVRQGHKEREPKEMTVSDAISKYIELSSVLSPTTIHAYKKVQEYAFPALMQMPVKELNDQIMQMAINSELLRKSERTGKPLSPKTIKNEWGLVASALKAICNLSFNIRLPKVQHENRILPEPSDVYNAIKGTDIELPCLLAMWLSFSMSEIRGLMCSSIKGDKICIDQVMVDVGTVPTVKTDAKVDTRKRMLKIPPYLMQLINNTETYTNSIKTGENAFLIDKDRKYIYYHFTKLMKDNGMDISFHDLRHINASVMLALGVPDKYAMERGGWSTTSVMKGVYQNTFSSERQKADSIIDAYFNKMTCTNNAPS